MADTYKVDLKLGGSACFSGLIDHESIREIIHESSEVVDSFPLLYSLSHFIISLELNVFLEHRYRGLFKPPRRGGNQNPFGGVSIKTVTSIANSLVIFLSWIEATDLTWDDLYASTESNKNTAWLPAFRFRTYLIKKTIDSELSRETANLYINHVRQFYEWAWRTGRVKRLPFKYSVKVVRKNKRNGEFDYLFSAPSNQKALAVTTNNLAIPRKYKKNDQVSDNSLTPYSDEELKLLFGSEYSRKCYRQLYFLIALATGGRAVEIPSILDCQIVDPNTIAKKTYAVSVTGKYGKERELILSGKLMARLYEYKTAKFRLNRCEKYELKWGTDKEKPLFLNSSGSVITSASISNLIYPIRKELSDRGVELKRTFHDLRSTFATFLAKFMLDKGYPLGFIQYQLMKLLGHENFSTTLKYINFARTVTYEDQMSVWVQGIFEDLDMDLLEGEVLLNDYNS